MKCDICDRDTKSAYVDGKTAGGPWANMCLKCHKMYGCGLGTGLGQKYEMKASDDQWVKVEG